jgi:hypothetical protein
MTESLHKDISKTSDTNITESSNKNITEKSSSPNSEEPSKKIFYIDSEVFSSSFPDQIFYSNSNLQLEEEEKTTNPLQLEEEEKTTNPQSSSSYNHTMRKDRKTNNESSNNHTMNEERNTSYNHTMREHRTTKTESSTNITNNNHFELSSKELPRKSAFQRRVNFELFNVGNGNLPQNNSANHVNPDNPSNPANPNFRQRLKRSCLLPPQGMVGQFLTLALIVLTLCITW